MFRGPATALLYHCADLTAPSLSSLQRLCLQIVSQRASVVLELLGTHCLLVGVHIARLPASSLGRRVSGGGGDGVELMRAGDGSAVD